MFGRGAFVDVSAPYDSRWSSGLPVLDAGIGCILWSWVPSEIGVMTLLTNSRCRIRPRCGCATPGFPTELIAQCVGVELDAMETLMRLAEAKLAATGYGE